MSGDMRIIKSCLIVSAIVVAGIISLVSTTNSSFAASDPVGVWYDAKRAGVVQISKCGSVLCGKIVWLKDPIRKDGKPLMDIRNSSKAQRGRKICGLQVLGSLKPAKSKTWMGWVYSPRRGKRYSAKLTLKNPNTLLVRGYVRLVALGKTETWKRAPDGLKGCDVVASKATSTKPVQKKPIEQKKPSAIRKPVAENDDDEKASSALKAD